MGVPEKKCTCDVMDLFLRASTSCLRAGGSELNKFYCSSRESLSRILFSKYLWMRYKESLFKSIRWAMDRRTFICLLRMEALASDWAIMEETLPIARV